MMNRMGKRLKKILLEVIRVRRFTLGIHFGFSCDEVC